MSDSITEGMQADTLEAETPTPDRNRTSSPLIPASDTQRNGNSKPRKQPTVTPRTFTRFFTPRSTLKRDKNIGASRQALRDITASAANRKGASNRSPQKDRIKLDDDFVIGFKDIETERRKRRVPCSPETTPDRSSPSKRIRRQSLTILDESRQVGGQIHVVENWLRNDELCNKVDFPTSVVRSKFRGTSGKTLYRDLGIATQSFGRLEIKCTSNWQSETTNFYSRPEDSYTCTNVVGTPDKAALPFCTVSCNTNSLVAIGDEEGGVRLLESAKGDRPGFSKAYLTLRPHANAVLDLHFSTDDMLLATASGDQTSHVIDMPTQRAIYSLAGHDSSIKQIRFQPGGANKVIASSSRDGSVHIWDLRCKGIEKPAHVVRTLLEPDDIGAVTTQPSNNITTWARSVNHINEAHIVRQPVPTVPVMSEKSTSTEDSPSKTERQGRRGDVSITALSFLQSGREHLLVTGSEANASVKLWDLRTTYNNRRGNATPVSTTRQPQSHDKHRQFGLTSLAFSGDGGRLYTLCRDNTVYAYSTSHLVLGHAPELASSSTKARRPVGPGKEGLGPLYGFRHPQFKASTFYVKLAVRPGIEDKTELLAVGSSDSCAVIFPTNERYMDGKVSRLPYFHTRDSSTKSTLPSRNTRPTLSRSSSGVGLSARLNDTIPIYQHGSALVRGHDNEVTSLSWTSNGELVTVGDDFQARCWREGPESGDLRTGGEKNGRRWGCGWAEADAEWDHDG